MENIVNRHYDTIQQLESWPRVHTLHLDHASILANCCDLFLVEVLISLNVFPAQADAQRGR
jgi:hypothetical protein